MRKIKHCDAPSVHTNKQIYTRSRISLSYVIDDAHDVADIFSAQTERANAQSCRHHTSLLCTIKWVAIEREREFLQSFMESFFSNREQVENSDKIFAICRSIYLCMCVCVDALSRITHCVALYIWLCRHWFEHQPHCTTHSTHLYMSVYIFRIQQKAY